MKRVLIVNDENGRWFIRRVRASVHDLTADEVVYYCDLPIPEGVYFGSAENAIDFLNSKPELMPHHKRKRPKKKRAGCPICKPSKQNHSKKETRDPPNVRRRAQRGKDEE